MKHQKKHNDELTRHKCKRATDLDQQMKIFENLIQQSLLYFEPHQDQYRELEKLAQDIQKNEMLLLAKHKNRHLHHKS